MPSSNVPAFDYDFDGVAELASDIEEGNRRIESAEDAMRREATRMAQQAMDEMDATILRDLEAAARHEVQPIREIGHELPVEYIPGRSQGTLNHTSVRFDPEAMARALGQPDTGTFNREALRAIRDEINRHPLMGVILEPRQLPLITPEDRQRREMIRAAEDREVFARLDAAATGNGLVPIYTGMRTEFPPGSPVVV